MTAPYIFCNVISPRTWMKCQNKTDDKNTDCQIFVAGVLMKIRRSLKCWVLRCKDEINIMAHTIQYSVIAQRIIIHYILHYSTTAQCCVLQCCFQTVLSD